MPLKISEIIIDPREVGGEEYAWVCSLCGLPLEVDWKAIDVSKMPFPHSLEYCLTKLFEAVKVKGVWE